MPGGVAALTRLIDNDVASADVGENLGSTLEVDSVLVIVADEDTHVLSLAREREHLDYLSIVASLLVWHPVQLLCKAQESCLRLGAHKFDFASLAICILKCSGVDCDSLVEQLLQGRREYIIKVGLLDGKVVGMLALLLSVGFFGVGPGEVLLQVLDEFGVDTDRARNDGHDVLGEGPGFIRADDGGICHSLARAQNANQEVLISHSLGRKRQRQGNCKWETWRGRISSVHWNNV